MSEQNDAAPPELPYFSVSNRKLLVMTLSSFGLYGLYWFYKNWTIIQKRDSAAIRPFWRAFFAPFFCHPCFKDIQPGKTNAAAGQEQRITYEVEAKLQCPGEGGTDGKKKAKGDAEEAP